MKAGTACASDGALAAQVRLLRSDGLLGCTSQVSEAMLETARKNSLPGTVHISTPSANGFSSIGTAADGTVLWSDNVKRDSIMA